MEHECKLTERNLKRQLAWISENGARHLDLQGLLGPIPPLPRVLIGENSLPYKANKSSATQCLSKRNFKLPEYPPPHTAILEGMFMIQSSPLPTMSCMREYTEMLVAQYVRPHVRAGA